MATNASNSTTLLSVTEFLKRCDWRTVAQLVSDTLTAVTLGSLASDENLLAALVDASGDVESFAVQGGRYSAADLAALTGVTQKKLFRLITRLTVIYLYERRPLIELPKPWYWDETLKALERLRTGENIFATEEHIDAGKLDQHHDTRQTVDDDRPMITSEASRFFGLRQVRRRMP